MQTIRATVAMASDPAVFDLAFQRLKAGGLVAFPTETVYGLGAHALDERAVRSIFEAKQRPLTDPVIVHIHERSQVDQLVAFPNSEKYRTVAASLFDKFWPGPLTVIMPASQIVPPCVCANTGFVGIRMPSHPIAHRLLQHSNLPIAAPSANRFGHVSPTTAQHVLDDLADKDVLVIDGGRCSVGVESSVVKIDLDSDGRVSVSLLRRGAVTLADLHTALQDTGCTVGVLDPSSKKHLTSESDESVSQVAPGQLLKHYAPDHPTFLVSAAPALPGVGRIRLAAAEESESNERHDLSCAVVIDFGGRFAQLQGACLAYRDLSPSGDFAEAAYCLFDALRWTEVQAGAKCVVLCDVLSAAQLGEGGMLELSGAVYDRMYRAASGRFGTLVFEAE